jgi:hypothetical protein
MLRKEVFERVGHFSKEYFMYTRDIDLCYKVQALGLRNYYVPDATVIHYGGGSSQEAASTFSVVLTRESICRFLSKTRGRAYAMLYRGAMFCVALLRLATLGMSLIGERRARNFGARRKWRAVLQWTVFRRSMVKRFEPIP